MSLGSKYIPALIVALCNGVRGLKYYNNEENRYLMEVALCNGVRGLK